MNGAWHKSGGIWTRAGRPSIAAGRAGLVYGTYEPTPDVAGTIPGITRTNQSGDLTITNDGTVVKDINYTGFLRVRAKNVIIQNIQHNGPLGTPTGDSALIDINGNGVTGTVIQDCDLNPITGHYYTYGVNGHHFTARRNRLRNLVDGFQPYDTNNPGTDLGVDISGNIMEEFYWSAVPAGVHSDLMTHNDAVQLQDGRGVKVWGNKMDMHYSAQSAGTPPSNGMGTDGRLRPMGSCTALMYTPNFATKNMGPMDVQFNWIYGGSYPINAGATGGFDIGKFMNNKFDHNQGQQNSGGNLTRVILLAGGSNPATTIDWGSGSTTGSANTSNVYMDNGIVVPVQRA